MTSSRNPFNYTHPTRAQPRSRIPGQAAPRAERPIDRHPFEYVDLPRHATEVEHVAGAEPVGKRKRRRLAAKAKAAGR